MTHFIGIDIGTTHVKAVVAADDGRPVYNTKRAYPSHQLQKGWHEQDAREVLRLVIEVLNEAVKHSVNSASSLSVCFSSAMHSLLAVNESGDPLCSMMTWADTRSNAYALKLKGNLQGAAIYEQTGTPVHPMSPLCKIAWLRDNEPGIFMSAYKFISVKEFIFFHFFGEYVIDYSIASATGLFDIRNLSWCDDALAFAGIDATRLSRPVPPASVFSALTNNIRQQLHFEPAVKYVIGAGDGLLANIGAGAVASGELALTIGTSGAIRKLGSQIIADRSESLFNYAFDGHSFLTGGAINNGGIVLQWLAGLFFADKTESDAHLLMMSEAEMVNAGSDGLIFLPYIYGERAPVWDATAKGVFIGISASHTRGHFIRAVIEGICFSLLEIMRRMEERDMPVKAIFANGGFIRSKLWLRIMTDVLNKPLFVSHSGDASAMGAIFLAMRVAGKITDWNDVKKLVTIDEAYHPQPAVNQTYLQSYAVYEHLYEKLQADFSAIDAIQNAR